MREIGALLMINVIPAHQNSNRTLSVVCNAEGPFLTATHNKTKVANDKMTPPMRCLSALVKKPAMPLMSRGQNTTVFLLVSVVLRYRNMRRQVQGIEILGPPSSRDPTDRSTGGKKVNKPKFSVAAGGCAPNTRSRGKHETRKKRSEYMIINRSHAPPYTAIRLPYRVRHT
jgi:hypothetical protein